ncbi:MAG: hypothetical protein JWM31_1164 [Solirubrobacterales bacterium]|nr:hypothetical protein [Solirubrobacterales bacterium]
MTSARSATPAAPRPAGGPKLPVYTGPFTAAHAERLLFRAGFGPRPGEAAQLAKLGLDAAVRSLVRPVSSALVGPAPSVDGHPLAPGDAWGHEGLWWLDRMVRSADPLTERLTLVFHDWFATSDQSVEPRLMLAQNKTIRAHATGRFPALLLAVTKNPAMLLWLNGTENDRDRPNENYARELLELFALGAGRGYREQDVRELARALSGFRNDWTDAGPTRFRFDPARHDGGVKTIFGHRGRYGWKDALRLVLAHPQHPAYFVRRLWDHFVPVAPPPRDAAALAKLYRASGGQIRPVVEAILRHPLLHEGPRMVKPPIVYLAGLLRAIERGVDTDTWSWQTELMGQRLFTPPNVAGWDASRWIDTATWRGRWLVANTALEGRTLDPDPARTAFPVSLSAAQAVDRALAVLGGPTLSAATREHLERFSTDAILKADRSWKLAPFSILRHNALLMLIATSPDLHTC